MEEIYDGARVLDRRHYTVEATSISARDGTRHLRQPCDTKPRLGHPVAATSRGTDIHFRQP